MIFPDSLRMAWLSLLHNKLRSALTMLGIIIGVAAVISLVTLGQGAAGQVTSQVQALGSNLITVTPSRAAGTRFTAQDATMLVQRVPGVVDAMPEAVGSVTSRWQNHSYNTSLVGAWANGLTILDRTMSEGRFFTNADVQQQRDVAVVGQKVAEQLFQGRDPVGQTLTVNGRPLHIIGLLASKGGAFGPDPDDMIVAPLPVAQRALGSRDVSVLYAQTRSSADAAVSVAHIEAIFNHIVGRDNAVNVLSQQQLLEAVGTITATLTLMLGGISGISLLVGGIGIMNIMLVTVTERTREIGLRKALGAPRRAILWQFLTEAVVLCLVGGAVGIALGEAGASVVAHLAGWPGGVDINSVLLAVGFSAGVGVLFGFWPAWNAARLDPIVALRRE